MKYNSIKAFIYRFGFLSMLILYSLVLISCGPYQNFDNDDEIIKGGSVSAVGSVESTIHDVYSLSINKLNGVKTIKTITVPENPTFTMTLSIESGRCKVVLIKDNLLYLVTDSSTNSPVQMTIPSGNYSLRVVGEDAKFKFTFTYDNYNS